jgi:transposase
LEAQSYIREESVVSEHITFVGLDVHKETIAVAHAEQGAGDPVWLGQIPNRPEMLARTLRKLQKSHGSLLVGYEAGPCGYAVYRQLQRLGIACLVVAPSLIPTKPGDRVKTDRRDALKLARLLRSGDLSPVWVPDEKHEGLRDVTRAREDAVEDLQRARQRLSKLLLRLDLRPPCGVKAWTKRYREWLHQVRTGNPAQDLVTEEYRLAISQAEDRIKRLETAMSEDAADSPHAPVIAALQAMRGVQAVTAITLVAELDDLTRFRSARQVMSYAGVVPREDSSGKRQQRGPITKTGNAHLRRVIVEGAWHYRHAPHVGKALKRRQQGVPESVIRIAYQAQVRLHRRYQRLLKEGKPIQKVAVALAREWLGFVWAIGQEMAHLRTVDASGEQLAA